MSNARENVNLLTSADWDIATLRLANWGSGAVPPQVVLKTNYVAGDGGGLFRYDASDTTTADNGGTVIVDVAGNRWKRQWSGAVNVKWFGARGNGTTNDAAAIQAAIDYVETLNGGQVSLGQGNFRIESTLNINAGLGVQLLGEGADGIHDGGTGAAAATTITWHGAASGTMLNITSPSGAANSRQFGSVVSNIKLDCRSVAGIALLANSVRDCTFTRLFILSPTIAGVKTTTLGNANLAESSDIQRCVFDRIQVRATDDASTRPAHGLWLTSHSPVGSNSNTSLNLFTQCDMQMWGGAGSGYGLFLEDGDNNTFNNLRVSRVSATTVEAVRIVGNTNCDANHFWNLSAGGVNGITIKGTASGFAINPTRNSFWVTDDGNGTQYPTADANVQFVWHADAGQFDKLAVAQLGAGDGSVNARTQRAALTNETLRLGNGSSNHLILTDGTNIWGLNINGASGLRVLRLAGAGNFDVGSLLVALGGVVSVGANDSGGAGFKVLRIPN
jgi:hypothetical protein